MLEALYFAPLRREAETQTQTQTQPTQVDTQVDTSAYVHQPPAPSVEEALQAGRPRFDLALDKATDWQCTFDVALAAVDAVQAFLAASKPSPPPVPPRHLPRELRERWPAPPRKSKLQPFERLAIQGVPRFQVVSIAGRQFDVADEHLTGRAYDLVCRALNVNPPGSAQGEWGEHRHRENMEAAGLRPDGNNPAAPWVGQASPSPLPSTTLNAAVAEHHQQRAKGEPTETDEPPAEMTQAQLMREAYNLRTDGHDNADIAAALQIGGHDREQYVDALIRGHQVRATEVDIPPNDFAFGARRR